MLPRSRSGALVAALVLGLGILGVVDAAAAPPRNDDFRDAKVIDAFPFEHRTNTRDATTEDTDPRCLTRRQTVWYSFTATETDWLVASTAGSDYNTTLSVYTGTRRNLRRVRHGCNDDSGIEDDTSSVHFKAAAGKTYHFMVSSRRKRGGHLVFGLALPCIGALPTITGTPGDDFIEGTSEDDVIVGLEGNDTIIGGGGSDRACGDKGNDTIEEIRLARGGDGDDHVDGGTSGDTSLHGNHGNDTLIGGFGADELYGGLGDDVMRGNEAGDFMDDRYGSNEFYGGWGGDSIHPGRGTSVIVGGQQHDAVSFFRFPPEFNGIDVDLAAGTILVEGTFVHSVDGIEEVLGTSGSDTFVGSDGNDFFYGDGGSDSFDGAFGDDFLYALVDEGPVTISGSDGDDYISGSDGNDQLSGDAGDDVIYGNFGEDNINGGAGSDSLDGGPDSDSCLDGERIINCE